MLTSILDDSSVGPTFNDPAYQRKLAKAARLSGPERYLTYGKLDLDLARNAAPLAAFGNLTEQRLLLRANRLPDLRDLRHGPRRALHQAHARVS